MPAAPHTLVPDVIHNQHFVTLGPKQTVREAVRVLAERNIGAIMITEGARLVGILSERDVIKRVLQPGRDLDTPIEAVMTPNPDTLPPSATIRDAMGLMVEHDYRHVPVLDGQKIVGIVSARDIYGGVVRSIKSGMSDLTRVLLG